MSTQQDPIDVTSSPVPANKRPPLGLPPGSVRALLTLLIVAVVISSVVRGQQVAALWIETLMIALAHYFTSRRFIDLPEEVSRQLVREGHLVSESNPLYLPRHSIRIIILAAFASMAYYLHREDRLFEPQTLSILGVLSAYLLGNIVRTIMHWWSGGKRSKTINWWEDLRALTVLGVLLFTATAYLADRQDLVPLQLRNATLGLVLFYFGSR